VIRRPRTFLPGTGLHATRGFSFGWLTVAAVLAAAIAGAIAAQPFVAALAGLALVVMLVSHLWARLSLEEVGYRRTVSLDHVFVGDELELTITVDNRKPLPLSWVRVRDHVPRGLDVLEEPVEPIFPLQAAALDFTTNLAWYERVRFSYRLKAAQRGFYAFGPARLESGDLFGVYTRERRYRETTPAVIVYPETVPLADFYLPSGKPVGEAHTRIRAWEDPSLPSGLREYRPGDSLRRIDWKATARRREVLVRTYDPSVAHHVVLVVDVMTVPHPWEGIYGPFLERAVTGAASVASRAFELGYRVGLLTNGLGPGQRARTVAAPDGGVHQLAAVLEALATIRPITVGAIEEVIDRERDAIPFGATVVAVSPLLMDGLRAKLADLRHRGHPVLAIHVGGGDLPDWSDGYEVRSMGEVFDLGARARDRLFRPKARVDSRA